MPIILAVEAVDFLAMAEARLIKLAHQFPAMKAQKDTVVVALVDVIEMDMLETVRLACV